VLEDKMVNGHALAVGDLDGDGRDEIVAGFRGEGFQLYIFTADDGTDARWTRHTLDPGGMAAADCKIANFYGDGRPAIACSVARLSPLLSSFGGGQAAFVTRGCAPRGKRGRAECRALAPLIRPSCRRSLCSEIPTAYELEPVVFAVEDEQTGKLETSICSRTKSLLSFLRSM
jgi:hypothetical protein